jgi:hypothetical protein
VQQHYNLTDCLAVWTHSATCNCYTVCHLLLVQVLQDPKWPEKWPFRPEDFLRYDESDDSVFYDSPRFVYHIDDGAVKALTQ